MKKHFILFMMAIMMIATTVKAQIISTVAGNGINGYTGDGGLATLAKLDFPGCIRFDSKGNLYIADNTVIRKVSTQGIISTIAGNGMIKSSGDGGLATSASFDYVGYIVIDRIGNIYISDVLGCRIRKVDLNGFITTVAGNGSGGYSGDGGLATSAQLYEPQGLAIDIDGNLYIADQQNGRVRKVDKNGIITTVAGNGIFGDSGDGGLATLAAIDSPVALCFDNSGNLLICNQGGSTGGSKIKKVDKNGIITTIAGNGIQGYGGDNIKAINSELNNPFDITTDNLDNLYIADDYNNRIRKIDKSGIITTIVGDGNAGYNGDGEIAINAELNAPASLTFDTCGNLLIADLKNYRIRKVMMGLCALPITLANFTAILNSNAITIQWKSETELNTNYFIIQRSNDGINFTDLSSVNAIGSGSNNYQFTDLSPVKGNNYYRLKSVDKDGSFSYSKLVSVNTLSRQGFTIVPNPAVSNTTLCFSGLINSATINVYNTAGQKVYTDKFSGSSTSSYILPTSKLSAGTYIVNVITKEGKYSNRLVITK